MATGFNFGSNAPQPSQPQTNALNLSSTTATSGCTGCFTSGNPIPKAYTGPGFNFGVNAAQSTAANPLLGGTTSSVATVNPLLGGTTSAAPTPGFSFGNKPMGTAAPISSGTSTSGPGFFSLGTSTATSGTGSGFSLASALGSTAASTAAPTLGGGFSFSTPAATTTTSAVTPFNFASGLTATSQAATTTSTSTFTGLGGSSTLSIGLGGAQPPTSNAGTDVSGAKLEGKPSKETPLPQAIFATIGAFESFRNEEKSSSEANLRQNATAFHKLGEDSKKLRSYVTELSTLQDNLQRKVNAIKEKIMKEGNDIEMARRTHNTPIHIQGDNTDPELYFSRLLSEFESYMLVCKERIEEVEKCMAVSHQNNAYDESTLRELVRRQHEDLQLAASMVYKVHSKLLLLASVMPCPESIKPKPLFRPGAGDLSKLDSDSAKSGVPKESAVVRSCFDLPGGESRLGAFQTNMAKAKALSINSGPPPVQPLQATPSLFGTSFTSGSTFGMQNNPANNTFASGFNTSGLGNSSFGARSNNNQAGSLFSSTFGQSNKQFKT